MSRLLDRFDALLFDLDGVVYVGPHAVPHAVEAIEVARGAGVDCVFITNNAARMPDTVAQHLTELGIPTVPNDVVTSPQAAVTVLGDFVPEGARILVIGGSGIADELRHRGYVPVTSLEDDPAAILQGFSPDLGWRDLAEATFAVRSGLPWIATNPDRTFPTPRGAAPGNGALVSLVAEAAGRRPDAIAGKPEPPLMREALTRCDASRPLMVGDRLDTDIAAGERVGIPSLLVLTGVTTPEGVLRAQPGERPEYIGLDLRVLLVPYPDIAWIESDATGRARVACGTAIVCQEGGRLSVETAGEPGGHLDILRAACALTWAEQDAGRSLDLTDFHDWWGRS